MYSFPNTLGGLRWPTRRDAGPTAYNAVLAALQAGYRHVDTAAFYHNEADVGRAVAESGLPREEVFITTKLWTMTMPSGSDGYSYAMKQAEESLRRLDTHIDLYLIHSPHHPAQRLGMWRALVDLRAAGRVRSIGVSNYGTHHIDEIVADGGVLPAVNQVEVHPFLLREKLAAYCEDKGILIQAYSPLAKASKLRDPTLLRVAAKHGKSVAQVMIRFSLQKGYITLPKSQHPQRIAENAQVFDFELLPEDMRELNALDTRLPTGWDPTKLR
mmetsp:Transcript_6666/g.17025  ORF Transcript_6666/g.17025 Transcript_6666/m.17025 type:complete len:271 (+) Transcript_6666:3-815(+)